MKKYDKARNYLISLGAKKSEIKPYFWLFYKITGIDGKPIVFENPLKILILQTFIGSIFFYGAVWLILHSYESFNYITLIYTSLSYGFISGLFLAANIIFTVKNLKLSGWKQWKE